MIPACGITRGWVDHLSHPSGPTPGPAPTLNSFEGPTHPLLDSKQGKLLVFAPSSCSASPSKALPEFLICPLISFYWLKVSNKSNTHLIETIRGILNFDFFPPGYSRILSRDAGSHDKPQLLAATWSQGKQIHLTTICSVPRQPSCFSHSVTVFNKLREILNTLL